MAIIPVVYLIADKLAGKKAGLIGALLISVNSLLIYYSQEVRVYALASLFSAISILFLVKIYKNKQDIKITLDIL
ncbi:MAG: DUF2723 domain-containing protein [Desulfomicrobium escambiense]|nr:DUF2723 domain-containing protein [Desulfomicrobium escambiense]